MKRNFTTVLIFSIFIFVDFSYTKKTCNCEKNLVKNLQNKTNNVNNKNSNAIEKETNEIYNDYDYEEDGNDDYYDDNEDITESGHIGESNDSNDSKTKRQIKLPNRRRSKHILNMIPLHRVPVIMYNAVSQTISPSRDIRHAQGTELTKLAKGFTKAIRTRHLSGFVGGLGLHAADFVDHFAEVSKDVIDEHERNTRSNQEHNIWGKLSNRIKLRSSGLLAIHKDDEEKPSDIHLPFENFGKTVRGLVELIPAKKRKRYYYKHYEPLANEIKKGLNSTEFRSFLRNTYTSDLFSLNNNPVERKTSVRFQKRRIKRLNNRGISTE